MPKMKLVYCKTCKILCSMLKWDGISSPIVVLILKSWRITNKGGTIWKCRIASYKSDNLSSSHISKPCPILKYLYWIRQQMAVPKSNFKYSNSCNTPKNFSKPNFLLMKLNLFTFLIIDVHVHEKNVHFTKMEM